MWLCTKLRSLHVDLTPPNVTCKWTMVKLLLCKKYIEIGFAVRWQEKKNYSLGLPFFCKNSCPKIRPANSENSQDGLVPHGQLNTQSVDKIVQKIIAILPPSHGLLMPRKEIAFTAWPKIQSEPQIFRYGRSKFCLPHRPNFSDIFDLCLHWVSVVRDHVS